MVERRRLKPAKKPDLRVVEELVDADKEVLLPPESELTAEASAVTPELARIAEALAGMPPRAGLIRLPARRRPRPLTPT
jgi:hypothetical protein